jgi:hypothetical protein
MSKTRNPPILDQLANKKIRELRNMFRDKAGAVLEEYIQTALDAREAGEFDTAKDIYQWLLEHMPADAETGERMMDVSVDKVPKQDKLNSGPRIQIGVAIGTGTQKALPDRSLPVVEVITDDDSGG